MQPATSILFEKRQKGIISLDTEQFCATITEVPITQNWWIAALIPIKDPLIILTAPPSTTPTPIWTSS